VLFRSLGVAVRALRHRDLSRERLEARLAARGAAPSARAEALAALERAGLVDDARLGAARAGALAERGYGDDAIRAALEAEGLPSGAVAELEPELERARRLLGDAAGPARLKTLRRLAARGFAAETLAELTPFADEA
jgi:SOS response regulatory protein OraA/RecX